MVNELCPPRYCEVFTRGMRRRWVYVAWLCVWQCKHMLLVYQTLLPQGAHTLLMVQQVGEEMSGLLEKKGRGLGGFKRYFFTTNNLYLRYYASEEAAENDPPLGVFFLSALVRVVRTDPRCINLLFGNTCGCAVTHHQIAPHIPMQLKQPSTHSHTVKGIKSKQKRLRADTPELAQQWQGPLRACMYLGVFTVCVYMGLFRVCMYVGV